MRQHLPILLFFLSLTTYAQSYVSGGVLAYHGNAFERCVEDLNKALAKPSSLEPEVRAKAYFYRGMAREEIRTQNANASILGSDPITASINDLHQAGTLDRQWSRRSSNVLEKLLGEVRGSIESEYDKALSLGPDQSRPVFSRSIDRLLFCLNVKNEYETRVLLAKVYEAYGHVYFNMAEIGDPTGVQRMFLSHYSRAISHYEEALKIRNGGSKEVFTSLEVLAHRIGDSTRETHYGQLASQIGG